MNRISKMLTVLLFLVLSACGGSGGGSGSGPTTVDTEPAITLSMSTNTLVNGSTPTLTLDASEDAFSASTTVSIGGVACTSVTYVSATQVQCVVAAAATNTNGFFKLIITEGSDTLNGDVEVVASSQRTETFGGGKQTGDVFLTNGGTDVVTFDNNSLQAGTDASKFYFAIDNSSVATVEERVNNACPAAGDEYYLINMANKTLSNGDGYLKLGMKLEFDSSSSAKVIMTSSTGETGSTVEYNVFCNANKEVTLYTDNSAKIVEAYRVTANNKFAVVTDAVNDEMYVGMGNLTGGAAAMNNITQAITSGGPYAYDGGRYDLATAAYELVGNNVSLVVGDLCDSGKNVIAGDDKLFVKSRELLTGGVATGVEWNGIMSKCFIMS